MLEYAFFHNFSRRALTNNTFEHELSVLESILRAGLLLVPEALVLAGEPLVEGRKGNPIQFIQRRFSMTLLTPSELPAHGARFGRFAIEYDLASGRQLGAIPVIYLPQPSATGEYQTLDAISATLLYRLREVFFLLTDLSTLERSIEVTDETDQIRLSPGTGGDARTVDVASLRKVLEMLGSDKQSFVDLVAACQVIFHLFYPTDKRRSDLDSMLLNVFYYQQREWRIFSDILVGQRQERMLNSEEIKKLCAHDNFFSELIEATDPQTNALVIRRRAELCRVLERVDGRHPSTFIKRIWLPSEAKSPVTKLLQRIGCSIELTAYKPDPLSN
ncbi:hypothetical protein [Bradyrhizobium japonicum]|uniref:hypothetical protein n=1 Tax=Bradyrhizobium japonicum TaxID=375 RepID=UPI00200C1DF9|nr:hypothetical protein [Bradyrhizobium japonicum]UQD99943.1 hypothetical protein JEY30_06620 [Bradyrhizobium japonicum]